jgi:hypothetical protein
MNLRPASCSEMLYKGQHRMFEAKSRHTPQIGRLSTTADWCFAVHWDLRPLDSERACLVKLILHTLLREVLSTFRQDGQ